MDDLTHAVSGAALFLSMPRRPTTAWAVPLAMAIAAIPDIDVLFPRTPIDFLLLHRGITHALAALPVLALFCAILMYPLWRRGIRGAWTFWQTALFAFLLLLLHTWLDCVTTYGTLVFLPFSDYRVRLNGLFIVDIWLLVPLILACCFARRRPRLAALAMIWLLLYSGGAVCWRIHLQNIWNDSLLEKGMAPKELSVLPDAFSPLYWKVQYKRDGQCFEAPLAWNGAQTGPWRQEQSADLSLLTRLAAEDRTARIWAHFSLLPLQNEHDWEAGKEYSFYDWRFSSFVPFAQNIQNRRRDGSTPFRFMARVDSRGKLVAVRYIGSAGGSASGGDSGWQPPAIPKGRSGLHWLIGLDD